LLEEVSKLHRRRQKRRADEAAGAAPPAGHRAYADRPLGAMRATGAVLWLAQNGAGGRRRGRALIRQARHCGRAGNSAVCVPQQCSVPRVRCVSLSSGWCQAATGRRPSRRPQARTGAPRQPARARSQPQARAAQSPRDARRPPACLTSACPGGFTSVTGAASSRKGWDR
jgi:hypothetical protein